MKHPGFLSLLTAGLSIIFVFLTVSVTKLPQDMREHAASNFPHAVGNQIIDGNGNVLILHGAQLEGMLNGNNPQVIKGYQQKEHELCHIHSKDV